jgi:hypothetical protein
MWGIEEISRILLLSRYIPEFSALSTVRLQAAAALPIPADSGSTIGEAWYRRALAVLDYLRA